VFRTAIDRCAGKSGRDGDRPETLGILVDAESVPKLSPDGTYEMFLAEVMCEYMNQKDRERPGENRDATKD